jgi:hypothetical protein
MANYAVRNLPGSLGFAPVFGMYESTHPRLSKGIEKKNTIDYRKDMARQHQIY